MSSGLLMKLQALQYPAIPSLTADASLLQSPSMSHPSLRTLVAWLEASKIRLLAVGERAALQDVTNDARWEAAFDSYLQALNCTRPFSTRMSGEQTAVVLDWLAAQAIAAEYADHAGEFNALSKMWFIKAEGEGEEGASNDASAGGRGGAAASALDCSSEAFDTELQELASLFKLPQEASQKAAMLRVVRKRVEECLIAEAAAQQGTSSAATAAPAQQPGAAAASAAASSTAAAASSSKQSKRPARRSHAPPVSALPTTAAEVNAALDQLETGFQDTGDVLVERSARVLRLLFLHDLRSSQNLANELMALAQNYTSNPKTDSKLGAVGR